MSFFFNGSTVGKLDEKNRFVIPQSIRYGLVEDGKLEFFIGLGLGGCLAIYKKAEIEIETILTHLENQDKLILQILARMEKEEK